jgi:hypothetical protein
VHSIYNQSSDKLEDLVLVMFDSLVNEPDKHKHGFLSTTSGYYITSLKGGLDVDANDDEIKKPYWIAPRHKRDINREVRMFVDLDEHEDLKFVSVLEVDMQYLRTEILNNDETRFNRIYGALFKGKYLHSLKPTHLDQLVPLRIYFRNLLPKLALLTELPQLANDLNISNVTMSVRKYATEPLQKEEKELWFLLSLVIDLFDEKQQLFQPGNTKAALDDVLSFANDTLRQDVYSKMNLFIDYMHLTHVEVLFKKGYSIMQPLREYNPIPNKPTVKIAHDSVRKHWSLYPLLVILQMKLAGLQSTMSSNPLLDDYYDMIYNYILVVYYLYIQHDRMQMRSVYLATDNRHKNNVFGEDLLRFMNAVLIPKIYRLFTKFIALLYYYTQNLADHSPRLTKFREIDAILSDLFLLHRNEKISLKVKRNAHYLPRYQILQKSGPINSILSDLEFDDKGEAVNYSGDINRKLGPDTYIIVQDLVCGGAILDHRVLQIADTLRSARHQQVLLTRMFRYVLDTSDEDLSPKHMQELVDNVVRPHREWISTNKRIAFTTDQLAELIESHFQSSSLVVANLRDELTVRFSSGMVFVRQLVKLAGIFKYILPDHQIKTDEFYPFVVVILYVLFQSNTSFSTPFMYILSHYVTLFCLKQCFPWSEEPGVLAKESRQESLGLSAIHYLQLKLRKRIFTNKVNDEAIDFFQALNKTLPDLKVKWKSPDFIPSFCLPILLPEKDTWAARKFNHRNEDLPLFKKLFFSQDSPFNLERGDGNMYVKESSTTKETIAYENLVPTKTFAEKWWNYILPPKQHWNLTVDVAYYYFHSPLLECFRVDKDVVDTQKKFFSDLSFGIVSLNEQEHFEWDMCFDPFSEPNGQVSIMDFVNGSYPMKTSYNIYVNDIQTALSAYIDAVTGAWKIKSSFQFLQHLFFRHILVPKNKPSEQIALVAAIMLTSKIVNVLILNEPHDFDLDDLLKRHHEVLKTVLFLFWYNHSDTNTTMRSVHIVNTLRRTLATKWKELMTTYISMLPKKKGNSALHDFLVRFGRILTFTWPIHTQAFAPLLNVGHVALLTQFFHDKIHTYLIALFPTTMPIELAWSGAPSHLSAVVILPPKTAVGKFLTSMPTEHSAFHENNLVTLQYYDQA